MPHPFARLIKDEAGGTALEYAFIAGLISIVVAATLTTLGARLPALYSTWW